MVKHLFVILYLWIVISLLVEVKDLAAEDYAISIGHLGIARPYKLTASLPIYFTYRSVLYAAVWSDFPLHGRFMVMYLRDIYDHNFSRFPRPVYSNFTR